MSQYLGNTKAIQTIRLLILIVLFLIEQSVSSQVAKAQSDRRPNIIFVLADDLGWANVGCYGNKFNETPHIDHLAKRGIRFTQAYASAPVCSPYRASLMTGQYTARHGVLDYMRPDSSNPLTTSHLTLPEMLQQQGYTTGIIGKWHLTGHKFHGAEREIKAVEHGFDEEIAATVKGVGNGANFWPYVFRDQPISWIDLPKHRLGENEYLVDRMNLEAVEFIERHQDKPFFLYLSHFAVHTILNGRPDIVQKYIDKHLPGESTRDKCYLCKDQDLEGDSLHHWAGDHNPHLAAMLHSIDEGVGMIVDKLEELKLSDNTIIVFSSDNGGESNVTSNAPLRGGKSELYEGGIRVPLIVSMPNSEHTNIVCTQPTMNVDFYPTFLELGGIKPDEKQQLDGQSIVSLLNNSESDESPRNMFWHYPLEKPHFLGGLSSGAIRSGDMKLIEFFDTGDVELYDLKNDLGENINLALQAPKQVQALQDELHRWQQDMGIQRKLEPWMCQPVRVWFQDSFNENQASDLWFFQKEWTVEDGSLLRNGVPGENKRIFIKKPTFTDTLISVDFKLQGTEELRIMTGSHGPYNAVITIQPDRFRVNTASDKNQHYYPTIHGECPFKFKSDQWYTMQVEILGDQIVARVDDDHFVFGTHPILDQERTYFAFQVQGPSASFDNILIQDVDQQPRSDWETRRKQLQHIQAKRPWLPRSYQEEQKDLQTILRDQLYREETRFRELILQIDQCKKEEHDQYPDVFRTMKEHLQEIQDQRKQLHENNESFKLLSDRINKSRRAETDFLHGLNPDLDDSAPQQYKFELEKSRRQHVNNPQFIAVLNKTKSLEDSITKMYPHLFVTNEEIRDKGRAARSKHNNEHEFKALLNKTSVAIKAEREYLYTIEPRLKELEELIQQQKKKAASSSAN